MTLEWNGSAGVDLGAVATVGRANFCNPFWFNPFCLKRRAFAHGRRCGAMPRRGWFSLPTPSGWHNVVRGPHPQPVQWLRRQQRRCSKQWHGQWPAVSESWSTPTRRRWHRGSAPRLNPDEAKAAARTRVEVGGRSGNCDVILCLFGRPGGLA